MGIAKRTNNGKSTEDPPKFRAEVNARGNLLGPRSCSWNEGARCTGTCPSDASALATPSRTNPNLTVSVYLARGPKKSISRSRDVLKSDNSLRSYGAGYF